MIRPSVFKLVVLLFVAFAIAVHPMASSGVQMPVPTQRAAPLSPAETDAIARMRVESLRQDVERLSAPEMQGRGTGQPGGDRAADHIASRFGEIGLKPLGDGGGFKQAIRFSWERLLPDSNITVGTTRLESRRDFVVAPPFNFERRRIAGQLVLIGFGVQSRELRRDDTSDIDLTNKIAVIVSGSPRGVNPAAWARATAPASRLRNLVERKVSAIVFVGVGSERQPFSEIADYYSRRRVDLASAERPPESLPPIILMGDAGASALLTTAGVSYRQMRSAAEAGTRVSAALNRRATIELNAEHGEASGSNCVGLLEGSDSKLRTEAVAVMAHYDAYGIGHDDTIYPGAADNALGVAEMLAIAQALSSTSIKPRRSIVFLALTGEEYGGLGSQYWIEHPTWPIANVIAALNFDGIGTEVYGPVRNVVGHGSEHSSLGQRLRESASVVGLTVAPDPMPDEQSFYRSDHFLFAERGIPALMLQGLPAGDPASWLDRTRRWLSTDYHQATDTARDDWDWTGPRTLASVGYVLTLRVANSDARALWFDTSPFDPNKRRKSASGSG